MAEIVLYHLKGSPPSWSVRMMAEILGIKVLLKDIDFQNMEHKSETFRKINPMGTVPTIQDGDFTISESHTINKYLLEKYGNAEQKKLYPKGLKEQAYVDQVMFFDTGVAFIRVKEIALPAVFGDDTAISPKVVAAVEDVYSTIELYLNGKKYVAGPELTLADINLGSTVTSLSPFVPVSSKSYPRTSAWLADLHSRPYFKNIAVPGSEALATIVNGSWDRNKNK